MVRIFRWFRSLAKRAITSLPWVAGGQSPVLYSSERAITLIPLFASVRILADLVASLPVQTYRRVNGRSEPQTFIPPLLFRPAARDNLFEWLHKLVYSLALRGNAYGLIVASDDFGFPTQVEWLHPDEVYVDETRPTQPVYYWRGQVVPTIDIVHIAWVVAPGRVVGLSPVQAFASSIGVGLAATDYGRQWFVNGGVPSLTMRNNAKTLTPTESEEISERLAAKARAGKPLVHGNDWDLKTIEVNAEEAQFLQTIKANATQIAAIFGVPPEMVGGESGGSLTYNSPEQNTIYLVQVTLRPWLKRIEDRVSALLPGSLFARFNADAMIRTDLLSRYQAHEIALRSGWRNRDEIRALEDLGPIPDGTGQIFAQSMFTTPEPAQAARLQIGSGLNGHEIKELSHG